MAWQATLSSHLVPRSGRNDGSGRSAARCCELQHLNQLHGPHFKLREVVWNCWRMYAPLVFEKIMFEIFFENTIESMITHLLHVWTF